MLPEHGSCTEFLCGFVVFCFTGKMIAFVLCDRVPQPAVSHLGQSYALQIFPYSSGGV